MASYRMKQLPNALSILRIPLGLSLLVFPVLSSGVMALYLLCCLTDVLDGFLARRLNAQSELGARLDSAADFLLVAVLIWKLWPFVSPTVYEGLWVAAIALIRLSAAVTARLRFGVLGFLHTWGNKLTGILLGFYPFSLFLLDVGWQLYVLLAVATLSAVEELLIEVCAAHWSADRKSLFLMYPLRK